MGSVHPDVECARHSADSTLISTIINSSSSSPKSSSNKKRGPVDGGLDLKVEAPTTPTGSSENLQEVDLQLLDPKKLQTPNPKQSIVLDANIWMHDLEDIKAILYHPTKTERKLYIPYVVHGELDRLMKYPRNDKEGISAKKAIHFITELFSTENENFEAQDAVEDFNPMFRQVFIDNSDDRIINCCVQLATIQKKEVHFYTRDFNLFNKAMSNKKNELFKAYFIHPYKEGAKSHLKNYFDQNSEPSPNSTWNGIE